MDRSDDVLAELGQDMYSKRIRAGDIVLIGDEQDGWYSHLTWAAEVMYGLKLDKIGEALTYTSAGQMRYTDCTWQGELVN